MQHTQVTTVKHCKKRINLISKNSKQCKPKKNHCLTKSKKVELMRMDELVKRSMFAIISITLHHQALVQQHVLLAKLEQLEEAVKLLRSLAGKSTMESLLKVEELMVLE